GRQCDCEPDSPRAARVTDRLGKEVRMLNRCVVCRGLADESAPCYHCHRGEEPTTSRIDILRGISERHTAAIVDGVMVDAFTASMLTQVHDAFEKDETRALFERLPIAVLAERCWQLVGTGKEAA